LIKIAYLLPRYFCFLYVYYYSKYNCYSDDGSKGNFIHSISPIQNHSLKRLAFDLHDDKSLKLEKLVNFFIGFSNLQELCLANANLNEKKKMYQSFMEVYLKFLNSSCLI